MCVALSSNIGPELTSFIAPDGLSLTLHGASYPHPTNSTPTPQALVVTLLCATEASDPSFTSYDGEELRIEWKHTAACKDAPPDGGEQDGGKGDDKTPAEGDEPASEGMGSGVGFFFLMYVIYTTRTSHFANPRLGWDWLWSHTSVWARTTITPHMALPAST